MYDVATNQQWNAKSAFFHRYPLEFIDDVNVYLIDDRAYVTRTQVVPKVVRGVTFTRIALTHLADLLGQRHPLQEVAYTILDRGFQVRCAGSRYGHRAELFMQVLGEGRQEQAVQLIGRRIPSLALFDSAVKLVDDAANNKGAPQGGAGSEA